MWRYDQNPPESAVLDHLDRPAVDGQETELKESLGDFRAPGAPEGWGLGAKWGFNMFWSVLTTFNHKNWGHMSTAYQTKID